MGDLPASKGTVDGYQSINQSTTLVSSRIAGHMCPTNRGDPNPDLQPLTQPLPVISKCTPCRTNVVGHVDHTGDVTKLWCHIDMKFCQRKTYELR